jgi:hypothetical protein
VFKHIQKKGSTLLQGEVIGKSKNTLIIIEKIPFSPEPSGQLQSNFIQINQWKGYPSLFRSSSKGR